MKVVSVTVMPGRANGVPSLDSCAFTISKAFSDPTIAGFNTKVQVKVMSDPTTAASLLVVSVREDGVGTAKINTHIVIYYYYILTIFILTLNSDTPGINIHCYNISNEKT